MTARQPGARQQGQRALPGIPLLPCSRTAVPLLSAVGCKLPLLPSFDVKARRVLLILAAAALLAGLGVLSGRLFAPRETDASSPEPVVVDPAAKALWEKAAPWMFRDDTLSALREQLLLPFAVANAADPRATRRRGGRIELTFPRGRPLYSIAHDLEARAARAGIQVVQGREGGRAEAAEYLLRDAAGRTHVLRLLRGRTEADGYFRMALVVTDIGRASAADLKAWLDFPVAVTLVFPDTVAAPDEGASNRRRDVLIELPMEPVSYPIQKPGPRALFIHHTRAEAVRILRQRLKKNPEAAGFATKLGDRVIEHPGLMENVLAFVADRDLLFLDLTGSPRSRTPQTALATGAEAFLAVPQETGTGAVLRESLERRLAAARRSGEGMWVLRHVDGLPAALAALVRALPEDAAAPRWVTLRQLHGGED